MKQLNEGADIFYSALKIMIEKSGLLKEGRAPASVKFDEEKNKGFLPNRPYAHKAEGW